MKRIALIVCLAGMVAACQDLNQDNGKITIEEAALTQQFVTEGGVAEIKFTATGAWNVQQYNTNHYSWASINPTSGEAGENTIHVTVLKNETNDHRDFTFALNAGADSKEIKVVQWQKDALGVTENKFAFDGFGGTFEFDVNANIDFDYEISADWIKAAETKGLIATTLTFNVELNPSVLNDREATIVVKGGEFEETIKVTQDAIVPEYEFSQTNFEFGIQGGDIPFTVTSNIGFTIQEPEEDWLTVTKVDDNNYKLTATPLTTFSSRSANVYVVGAYEAESGAVLTVIQKGGEVIWSHNLEGDYACVAQADEIMCLAQVDGKLLIGDSFDIAALDLETGAFLQQIPLPDEITALGRHSFDSDDAGHVVLGGLYGNDFAPHKVYYADASMTFKELLTYDGDIYQRLGNFKASGDVTKNGVVTAFVDVSQYWAAWEFVDGTATRYAGEVPGIGTIWYPGYASAEPVGDKLSNGLIYSGYDGVYNLLYCADPKSNSWVTLYPALGAWDWSCIGGASAEFDGKRYVAAAKAAFAGSGQTGAYLIDVTDPAAPSVVYELTNGDIPSLNYVGLTGSADAELVVTDNAMYLVCVSGQFNHVSCVKFSKK